MYVYQPCSPTGILPQTSVPITDEENDELPRDEFDYLTNGENQLFDDEGDPFPVDVLNSQLKNIAPLM